MTPLNEKHIKMYAEAPFQDDWRPEVGDEVIYEDINRDYGTDIVSEVTKDSGGYILYLIGGRSIRAHQHIYKPSIEQMAGMWHEAKEGRNALAFTYCLSEFTETYMDDYPLQIIVLAFIMSELYSKRWSEEKGEWEDAL